MSLLFVADKDIPFVEDAFSTLGSVNLIKGSEINNQTLRNANGLITRTTTKVTSQLLRNTKVAFVGSATIGMDHVELEYLAKKGIVFTSAPGCNANAVGEFVANALTRFAQEKDFSLEGKTIGIIGAGNTGSAVAKKTKALGLDCLKCDPFLSDVSPAFSHVPIDELISCADIISLHVPLTKYGDYPTYHLINENILQHFKPNAILINTSRGSVIDECALRANRSRLGGLILDVWEHEPAISWDTLEMVDIATPHIAGYSYEGKVNATAMTYQKACQHFNLPSLWDFKKAEGMEVRELSFQKGDWSLQDILKTSYDIWCDDKSLRHSRRSQDYSEAFSSLRNNYSYRKEFSSTLIKGVEHFTPTLRDQIDRLGFKLI